MARWEKDKHGDWHLGRIMIQVDRSRGEPVHYSAWLQNGRPDGGALDLQLDRRAQMAGGPPLSLKDAKEWAEVQMDDWAERGDEPPRYEQPAANVRVGVPQSDLADHVGADDVVYLALAEDRTDVRNPVLVVAHRLADAGVLMDMITRHLGAGRWRVVPIMQGGAR